MDYFFKPYFENLYQILSWRKYSNILVITSTPPIAKPSSQEPVIIPESTIVSIVPIILHDIVFAICLL